MKLVDEGDDLPFGVVDFLQNCLQALLKLTAVFSTRNDGCHVERNQLLPLQGISDVASDDALGQALHHSGLPHAWLANKDRVVLGAPGQHLRHPSDLLVATNDRVEFSLTRNIGEVHSIELECALLAVLFG